jgi:hypothetical protein
MAQVETTRWVILRDLAMFQIKLILDGFKDLVLVQLATAAAALDLIGDAPGRGRYFYSVLRFSERMDLWLNLHGAATDAHSNGDGLFGASVAGSSNLVGQLERLVRGGDEARPGPRHRRRAAAQV